MSYVKRATSEQVYLSYCTKATHSIHIKKNLSNFLKGNSCYVIGNTVLTCVGIEPSSSLSRVGKTRVHLLSTRTWLMPFGFVLVLNVWVLSRLHREMRVMTARSISCLLNVTECYMFLMGLDEDKNWFKSKRTLKNSVSFFAHSFKPFAWSSLYSLVPATVGFSMQLFWPTLHESVWQQHRHTEFGYSKLHWLGHQAARSF